jgi:hypothetical protein
MQEAEMRMRTYTHGKGTTEVIEDDPGTRIARVIHLRLSYGDKDEAAKTNGKSRWVWT